MDGRGTRIHVAIKVDAILMVPCSRVIAQSQERCGHTFIGPERMVLEARAPIRLSKIDANRFALRIFSSFESKYLARLTIGKLFLPGASR